MIFTYQQGDRTYTVNLEPQPDGTYTAIIDDLTYIVRATRGADGGLLLDWGSGQKLIYTASNGDERYVHVNGQTFALSVADARASRRRAVSGGGDLTAQMPGQVVAVLVEPGDSVERGQALVILEAMKMEIRVAAPGSGTVRRVLVDTGDVVERGQRLVEISTPED